VRELSNACGLIAQKQFQHLQGCRRYMANPDQTSRIEPGARFRADAGKPFVRKRMQKLSFCSCVDFIESGWFG
jgi:hypothetical protein